MLTATINGLLGFFKTMMVMSTLFIILRPKRDLYLQQIVNSMKQISSGEYDRAHLEENNVKGFSHILRNPALTSAERNHYLDINEKESNRLSNLSTNMQKLSWLEEINSDLNKERFRLDQQIKEVSLTMEYHWSRKDIELSVKLQEVQCSANEELLNQVWINLLDNAIKFAPNHGQIQIELTTTQRGPVVNIKDNGIGMTEEEQIRIFERFYKSDRSRSPEKKGSGLGLSIVQKIIDLHQWKISVSSVPNEGTTFTVILTDGEEAKHNNIDMTPNGDL